MQTSIDQTLKVQEFYDVATNTFTYIVYDEESRDAVIIDPVWNFDPADGKLWNQSYQILKKTIQERKLRIHWILETHAHADHLSSSQLIKKEFPKCQLAISKGIVKVQTVFKDIFQFSEMSADGSQFDRLLTDSDSLHAGAFKINCHQTPGHTPACMTFEIGKNLFVGDLIFMPDSGTGRCDFPMGSAKDLYHSVKAVLYSFTDDHRIYVGHDYQPGGRAVEWQTTVGAQKKSNIHITSKTTEAEFIDFRTRRDKTLSAPRLLYPSIQVNMVAGHLPAPEQNGISYLKIPLKILEDR